MHCYMLSNGYIYTIYGVIYVYISNVLVQNTTNKFKFHLLVTIYHQHYTAVSDRLSRTSKTKTKDFPR